MTMPPSPASLPRGRAARALILLVLVAAAALAAAGLALAPPPLLAGLDRLWRDQLLRQQAEPAPADPVIIDIDERSLQELGPWPWPRPLLAQLAERLRAAGVQLQVWDLLLPEPASGDAALARELRHGDIILGQALVLDPAVHAPPQEGLLLPAPDAPVLCSGGPSPRGHLGVAPSLAAALPSGHAGHLSATPDPDGRLRRLPAVICSKPAVTASPATNADAPDAQRYPQLVLAAAAATTPGEPWRLTPGAHPFDAPQWLSRGPWRFALDAQGWLTIPYQRDHTDWPALSARLLLQAPPAALPPLRGRIAIVGATALGVGDVTPTPRHHRAPGLSVHAELLAQARAGAGAGAVWPGAPPRQPAWPAALLLLAASLMLWPWVRSTSGAGNATAHAMRTPWLAASAALALATPMLLAAAAWSAARLVWPVAAPTAAAAGLVLLALLCLLRLQRQQAQQLAVMLESFVPAALARRIAAEAGHADSLGHASQGCLLGLRIDGLDAWVARVDSLQALALIHALHASAQRVAQRHGGALEHAQGGSFYFSWGSVAASDAAAALACARALHAELTALLRHNERPERPLSAYIAIECGSYLLGLVGTERARRSVILGPAANDVAAMLALSPELASAIIVGPAAQQALLVAGAATVQQAADASPPPTGPARAGQEAAPTAALTPILHPLGRFLLPDRPEPQSLWWHAP